MRQLEHSNVPCILVNKHGFRYMFIIAEDELGWGRIVITVISFAKEGRNMKYTPDAVVFPGRNNDALLAALIDEAHSSAFFVTAALSS